METPVWNNQACGAEVSVDLAERKWGFVTPTGGYEDTQCRTVAGRYANSEMLPTHPGYMLRSIHKGQV